MTMERYQKVHILNNALYGEIVLCIDKENKTHAVVKIMEIHRIKSRLSTSGLSVQEDVDMELLFNQLLNSLGGHDNITSFKRYFEDERFRHMVFEYCNGGDLFEKVKHSPKGYLEESVALRYFSQITRGLMYLHSNYIAHRDLSLENILIGDNGQCKICDFGLAAAIPSVHSKTVGKLLYMAPEVFLGAQHKPELADLWSLGVILFIMLTGVPPYEKPNSQDARFALLKTKGVHALLKEWNMESYMTYSTIDLLDRLLVVSPTGRIPLSGVLRHPSLQPYIKLHPRKSSLHKSESYSKMKPDDSRMNDELVVKSKKRNFTKFLNKFVSISTFRS